jgi:lipoprotein-anchoring transpeptidase ErfK/SrfK
MKLTQKAAQKAVTSTFRFTRKTTGRIVGGSARLATKSLKWVGRNTIGRLKWYQRASGRANLIKNRIKCFMKNAKDKVAAPFVWVKKKIGGLISSLVSIIGTIISYIIGIFAFLLLAMLLLLVLLSAVSAAAGALSSVFAAIAEWWQSIQANTDSYIKNDPSFIAKMAANYRNAELRIYELFRTPDKIEVSTAPIYYSLYYTGEGGFLWFKDNTKPTLGATNNSAKNILSKIESDYGQLDDYGNGVFRPKLEQEAEFIITKYDSAKIYYYPYSAWDASANKLKSGAVASKFELSNAKDALALTDTLYTHNPEGMQKHEALAYLGVDEYQMATGGDTKYVTDNLFWNTHKFIYRSGTDASQIKFHTTNSTPTKVEESGCYDGTRDVYYVEGQCSNKKTLYLTRTKKVIDGVASAHYENESFTVEICQGHLDLDVAMIVTTINDGNAMFDAARGVAGLKTDTPHGSFLGIYTNDKVLNISGVGHVTWKAYNPSNDWAPDSQFRETAIAKTKGEITYSITNGEDFVDNHYLVGGQYPLKNHNGTLYYLLKVKGTLYYVEAYKSGEQDDLKTSNGTILDLSCENGTPWPHND